MEIGVLTALAGVLIYYLWRQGFMASKSIIAILFAFRPEKYGSRVYLDSCTGWLRHIGRFQSRGYEFHFDCRLSKGTAGVALLDSRKHELLQLDRQNTIDRIELHKGARYYLRWEFKNASGQCALRWQECSDPKA